MNDSALLREIQNDPSGIGYAPFVASGNDAGLADALNLPRDGLSVHEARVPFWRVGAWCADPAAVRYSTLETVALADPGSDPAKRAARNAARVALRQFDSYGSQDPFDVDVAAELMSVIVGQGFTPSDVAALRALGDRTPASRAEVLWGPGVRVTLGDISRALRGTS